MDTVIRAYVPFDTEKGQKAYQDTGGSNIILVLDAETTTDKEQELLFGTCKIWIPSRLIKECIFYADELDKGYLDQILEYSNKNGIEALSRKDFVEKVLMPYVYNARAICVGFNLPFDISRLAIKYGIARKNFKNGFSFVFSESHKFPRVIIKSLDSKRAFYSISTPRTKREQKYNYYRGRFLDLRTLAFALTSKSYSLESAAEDFNCVSRKTHPEEHGKVTQDYIDYNINDVNVTYELYKKLIERYLTFKLDIPPEKLFSPASLAKAYLNRYGIKPFLQQNNGFPKEIIGYIMTSYYGGRTEVKIRKKPVKITYLDFTSMYPTIYTLTNMDSFLKADEIEYEDATHEIQSLLESVDIEEFKNESAWKQLSAICEIAPDSDVLPVRSNYDGGNAFTIGINIVSSSDGTALWYTLSDLIADKFLSGKVPKIRRAIRFIPKGYQSGLRNISIMDGVTVGPEENIVKKLIDERLEIKSKASQSNNENEVRQLTIKQKAIKTIVNAMSYGIFVELDIEPLDNREEADVYGLNNFKCMVNRIERPGAEFNPIIATMLTSGARLVLAIAESLLKRNNGYLAYCDTDSVMVSPQHKELIQGFFRALNPYEHKIEMFKVEKDDERKPLENVNFFGISAKRYVLFDLENGKPVIRTYSSHGLGNIKGIDDKKVWEDILSVALNNEDPDIMLRKYSNKFAISELTITKPSIIKRFSKIGSIKPFNFVLVGRSCRLDSETNEPIIPIHSYVDAHKKAFDTVVYEPFVDYKSGKLYKDDSQFYWSRMDEVIQDYWKHPESKFDGDIGELTRKHVSFSLSDIRYIGKESNELEESEIVGVSEDAYTVYEDIAEKARNLTRFDMIRLGISKRRYRQLKKQKGPFKRIGKVIRNIESYYGLNDKEQDIKIKRRA